MKQTSHTIYLFTIVAIIAFIIQYIQKPAENAQKQQESGLRGIWRHRHTNAGMIFISIIVALLCTLVFIAYNRMYNPIITNQDVVKFKAEMGIA